MVQIEGGIKMVTQKIYEVAIARSGEIEALLKAAQTASKHSPDESLPQLDIALKRAEALVNDIRSLRK